MANVENINRLIQRIRDDKGVHMKMGGFALYLNDPERDVSVYEPCNTAFCICGHANMLLLQDNGLDVRKMAGHTFFDHIQDEGTGADFIGIDREEDGSITEADKLFMMLSAEWGLERFDSLPQQTRANAAIRVLEILRDTGKVDWDTAIETEIGEALRQIEEPQSGDTATATN